MAAGKRVAHSAAFKAKVAMAALQGDRTVSRLGGRFGVHPVQVAKWKRRLVEEAAELFHDGRRRPSGQGPKTCQEPILRERSAELGENQTKTAPDTFFQNTKGKGDAFRALPLDQCRIRFSQHVNSFSNGEPTWLLNRSGLVPKLEFGNENPGNASSTIWRVQRVSRPASPHLLSVRFRLAELPGESSSFLRSRNSPGRHK
jgi:transposase